MRTLIIVKRKNDKDIFYATVPASIQKEYNMAWNSMLRAYTLRLKEEEYKKLEKKIKKI